jgi:ABC-2 type transport system ATP-binding protein
MSENVIEVQALRKEFGSKVAVDNLTFSVKRGEIIGLLGPNGAGKTTTIHMLLGLTTPTSGSIRIFGQDLRHRRAEILKRTNFASAYQALPYNLKVWENLYIFSELYGIKNSKKKIEELMSLFELTEYRNQLSGRLSSGEQTRLNLCKSLLSDPELLLLDEPTASLDPDQADKVRKVLLQRQNDTGMTIINTSHNMIDVDELCDRILFIQHGKIIADGAGHHILKQYQSKSLEEVFIKIARIKSEEPS